jgi:transmembrane sensor
MVDIEQIKNKFLRGEADEAELQQLLEWIKQSPANRNELFNEKDIWDAVALLRNTRNYKVENELLQFNRSIHIQKKIRFPDWLKIAAMVVIAIGIGWLIRGQISNQTKIYGSDKLKEIIVPKGQMNQIFLADGTRIWLNSDSKILLPPVFVGNKRSVTLEGEAFFEVAKDKRHPFEVKTEGQVIEVLGTSFNVRAYKGNIIQTTLTEGKIKLRTAKQETILSPNEQSVVNRSTGKLSVKKVNTNFYDSWKEGRYEFVNENLVNVFKLVERWYDVELIYDANEFSNMYFSGVIRKDKPVSHFLQLLDLTIPVDYKMNGDKISIKKQ